MAKIFFDRETREFSGIDLKQLREAYKHIDVDAELRRMALWLMSPKGTKRQGNLGFIMNWLKKATPKPSEQPQSELQPWINEYLKGLWKGREHLLYINKKR